MVIASDINQKRKDKEKWAKSFVPQELLEYFFALPNYKRINIANTRTIDWYERIGEVHSKSLQLKIVCGSGEFLNDPRLRESISNVLRTNGNFVDVLFDKEFDKEDLESLNEFRNSLPNEACKQRLECRISQEKLKSHFTIVNDTLLYAEKKHKKTDPLEGRDGSVWFGDQDVLDGSLDEFQRLYECANIL